MRKLLLLPLLLLSSCASTPSSLKTFDDVYNAAITADDFVVTTATAALTSGLITSSQATEIQKITVDASNLLTAAKTAFTAGNQALANQNVVQATATLVAMSLCLSEKPLTVATFASCAVAVPPLPTASHQGEAYVLPRDMLHALLWPFGNGQDT